MEPRPINPSEANIAHLQSLVHPPNLLDRRGYILAPLSKAELDKKRRCGKCHKLIHPRELRLLQAKLRDGTQNSTETSSSSSSPLPTLNTDEQLTAILHDPNIPKPQASRQDRRHGGRGRGRGGRGGPMVNGANASVDSSGNVEEGQRKDGKAKKEVVMKCQSHPGRVRAGRWTCCNDHLMSKPCTKDEDHTPRYYAPRELEDNWKFFDTPYRRDDDPRSHAFAVTIDCEMGTNDYGETELIRVSAIDYFSGAVLLDKLVFPDVKMAHWNTRFSGVSAMDMRKAREDQTCLFGRAKAREALWEFVTPETVIVGHAVHGDLASLRWIHPRIVDTLAIEEEIIRREKAKRKAEEEKMELERLEAGGNEGEEAEDGEVKEGKRQKEKEKPQPLSLKHLTKERLDRVIQIKGRGHDSVEDALATRDLLHWHVVNRLGGDW